MRTQESALNYSLAAARFKNFKHTPLKIAYNARGVLGLIFAALSNVTDLKSVYLY